VCKINDKVIALFHSDNQNLDGNSDISEVQFFIDQVSEKYLMKIKEDRIHSDQMQIREMNLLLKDWADKISSTTKDILSAIQSSGSTDAANPLDGIVDDIRDRQTKMALVSIFYLSKHGFVLNKTNNSPRHDTDHTRCTQSSNGHVKDSNFRGTKGIGTSSIGMYLILMRILVSFIPTLRISAF
jgi:hypothetical protein